ncbi:hypothetical protein DICSQDRAFT_178651 [Dichomitus squalens LYAD-421 SS1]|uniref:uncharacterized protein n=1 Tax=Dichomitus squalens (strain LYAD-421) TaxID=732165 RepID=UPI00044156B5|nr:uncharacterized protein DICSQDRAFT_178651 [Dichomitus squalens LYAD-421 SS1]EJF64147.1 hypothetical protein DICSQDRAFT_178651 [Dichomitus squalens LYAD-421 SS1]
MCTWGRCHAELNSWKSLQEHLHRHCQEQGPSSSQGIWECKINRCVGRYHGTLPALQQHVNLSHLSRVALPCPIRGCTSSFGRSGNGLSAHIQTTHFDVLSMDTSQPFHQLRRPHPHPREELSALPAYPVPVYKLLCPTVRPARRGKTPTASQGSRRKWRRMDTQAAAPPEEDDDDDEEPAIPLADLPPMDLRGCPEIHDYFVRPKPPESWLQLSRPQQVVDPPVPEKPPAPSIGYDAFAARFEQLERAGLIDGKGLWPEEGWNKET